MAQLYLFALILLAASTSAAYLSSVAYAGTGCSGTVVTYAITTFNGDCFDEAPCVDVPSNGLTGFFAQSVKSSCSASFPELPGSVFGYAIYDSTDCSGSPSTVAGYGSNTCISAAAASTKAVCSGNQFTFSTYTSANCAGDAVSTVPYTFDCVSAGTGSVKAIGCTSGPNPAPVTVISIGSVLQAIINANLDDLNTQLTGTGIEVATKTTSPNDGTISFRFNAVITTDKEGTVRTYVIDWIVANSGVEASRLTVTFNTVQLTKRGVEQTEVTEATVTVAAAPAGSSASTISMLLASVIALFAMTF